MGTNDLSWWVGIIDVSRLRNVLLRRGWADCSIPGEHWHDRSWASMYPPKGPCRSNHAAFVLFPSTLVHCPETWQVATLISMWVITKIGRRTILLAGFLIQAVCMLILAVIYRNNTLTVTAGKVLVAFTIIYLFFYNFCIAPYVYLSAGEIPTQRLRGYTLGSAIGIAFFWNWLASYTAPYFLNPLELNWVRFLQSDLETKMN